MNDEDRFNVTNRLVLLFPRLDVDPTDGFVSESELTQWNMQQSQREAMHRSQREMETHDKNRDGFVTFAEYKAPIWVRNAGEFLLTLLYIDIYFINLSFLSFNCIIVC